MKSLSFGLMLLALSSGCGARLTVQVDIYNGVHRKLAQAGELMSAVDMLAFTGTEECPSPPPAPAAGAAAASPAEDEVKRVAAQLKKPATAGAVAADNALSRQLVAVCEARKSIADRKKALVDYVAQINNGDPYYSSSLETLLTELENSVRLFREKATKFDAQAAAVGAEVNLGGMGGTGIAGSADSDSNVVGYPLFDRLIPFIAADRGKGSWAEYSRNEFRAVGGDAQFVVVRDGLVVFHQKSLDFDPTPVIGAGTAVARLGLKVAAALASGMTGGAASGLGALGGAPASGGGGASTDATAADPEAQRQLLQKREHEKIMFLQDLAELYNQIPAGLNAGNAATYKARLKALVSHYEASLAVPAASP